MAELGREAGVSGPTAKQWISVLEASHVVHLLQPFHRNFGKRIRKSPKLDLGDPGLATFVLGLGSRVAIKGGPSFGALVETAVVSKWLKLFHAAGVVHPVSFWRTSHGEEVDLVIEWEGRSYGIEVKATATPIPYHADALAKWLELAAPKARGVIACRVDSPVPLRKGIRAVPWNLAW